MITTQQLKTATADIRERLSTKTVSRVAKVAGVTEPVIYAIRNGGEVNPTVKTLVRISEAMDSMEGVEHD